MKLNNHIPVVCAPEKLVSGEYTVTGRRDGRRDGLQFPALTEGQPHLALYLAGRSGGVRPAAPGLAIQVAATIYDAAADTAAPAAAEVTIFTPIAQMHSCQSKAPWGL